MKYDTIINRIGGFGKYQKLTCLFLCICSSLNAITSYILNFIMTNHDHRCRLPGYDLDHYSVPGQVYVNMTNEVQIYNVTECTVYVNSSTSFCNTWVYDQELFTATIISKFDIVCDKKFYRAHLLMIHYIGLLFGSVSSGFLSDTIGRKPVLALSMAALFTSVTVKPFVDSLEFITVLEFLNGYGSMVAYIAPFILLTELVGVRHRLFVSFAIYFAFCVGNYILLLIVYFIRDWIHLMYVISVPIGGCLVVVYFVDESPRWLFSRQKWNKAVCILQTMARVNNTSEKLQITEEINVNEDHNSTFVQFIRELFNSKRLLLRLAVICLNWFAINIIYFGISMNVAKFHGNVFINFAASSSAEALAILFCWFATDRFGRKKLFCFCMILGGVICLCTIFTALYGDKSFDWFTTTLAMVGKFFVSINFFVVYIFTAELFPTVLRASSIGFGSMTGRIGSIASAYIAEIGTLVPTPFGKALPLIIYGGIGLVAGLLALTLPETTNILLPEQVKDAKHIHRNVSETTDNVDNMDTFTENRRVL